MELFLNITSITVMLFFFFGINLKKCKIDVFVLSIGQPLLQKSNYNFYHMINIWMTSKNNKN